MRKALFLLCTWLFAYNTILFSQDTTQVSERIEVIQQMLDRSSLQADIWWYGWLGTYSAATVGQGVVCFTTDQLAVRQDMILGAATTGLGAAFQLLTPLDVRAYANKLSEMPDSTADEKSEKLKAAELYLSEIAAIEKAGRSWQIHAVNTAVNLSSGLITWIGFKRTVWDGVANFVLNSVIAELQIWTQPTRLIREQKRYQLQYLQNKPVHYNTNPTEIYFKTYPAGVLVGVRF